jgi:hypothetical protein
MRRTYAHPPIAVPHSIQNMASSSRRRHFAGIDEPLRRFHELLSPSLECPSRWFYRWGRFSESRVYEGRVHAKFLKARQLGALRDAPRSLRICH